MNFPMWTSSGRSNSASTRLLLLSMGLLHFIGCSRDPTPTPKQSDAAPAKAQSMLETLAGNCPVYEFKINGLRSVASLGQIYFAHPKSTCILSVAPNVKYLRFGYGIDDTALVASPKTGGVLFRISMQDGANNTA